ncbi:MAG: fumarate reductase/succinate dehydrogenase flavoprotein subunit, partial [Bacteroidales bacterium]|nr:fumarate reductase/succinate dehydrogenase flavoprotein subunit [Bacteroidales bacterium]
LMQGLADGYFVLPYTVQEYLADQFNVPRINPAENDAFKKAENDVKDYIKKLMSINGKNSVDHYHKELGKIMWNNVGMARTKESLETAIKEIKALREEFWKNVRIPGKADELNVELEKANRVADFLELGELIARDALHRNESCGGHFREESQEEGEAKRDDENFMYVGAWEYKGYNQEPELHKEPLNYQYIKVQKRNYKTGK